MTRVEVYSLNDHGPPRKKILTTGPQYEYMSRDSDKHCSVQESAPVIGGSVFVVKVEHT